MVKFVIPTAVALLLTPCAFAQPNESGAEAEPAFAESVGPFLTMYCADCHAGEDPLGQVVLEEFLSPAERLKDREVWEKALRLITSGQMPPEDGLQPEQSEVDEIRQRIVFELEQFDCTGKSHPGRVTIRRLNRVEYDNTIRDLLGIDFQPADDFPADDVGAGFDNIADVLSIPPILLEKYLLAAEQALEEAFKDPAARDRIYVCDPSQAEGDAIAECYFEIVESFMRRAYRRPVSPGEVERVMELGKQVFSQGAGPDGSLKFALQAVLASPHFLFRIELDPDSEDADAVRKLNDFELASRLSYFLWSSMPDAELFELARQGRLVDPAVLEQQTLRMLRDPKANALVENFAGQWLQLRDVVTRTPSTEQFPDFNPQLAEDMRRETEMLFEHVMREDRSILEFLDANYSFLNQRLASHYGIDGVTGDGFQKVALNDQRRGVMTHGSILLITSNPTRTSPVKRGKWILENLLDDPPPPPAPDVADLEEQPELLGSLRERMEQHRADPTCAVCHIRMDALGFGLENFDAVGAWREMDGRHAVDSTGTLPGGLAFTGPRELTQVLREHSRDDFCRCLAKKMLTYALGRELQLYDRCAVDSILRELHENDDRFSSLVLAIVTSDPFTLRGSQGPDS